MGWGTKSCPCTIEILCSIMIADCPRSHAQHEVKAIMLAPTTTAQQKNIFIYSIQTPPLFLWTPPPTLYGLEEQQVIKYEILATISGVSCQILQLFMLHLHVKKNRPERGGLASISSLQCIPPVHEFHSPNKRVAETPLLIIAPALSRLQLIVSLLQPHILPSI